MGIVLGAAVCLPTGVVAQAKPSTPAARTTAGASQTEGELSRRLKAADAARTTGNPETIGEANRKVIALALQQLGVLRSSELAYGQATVLYRDSLTFEERTDTRADLAASLKAAGRGAKAIGEADPSARLDASGYERAHFTAKQRATAESREQQLRAVLGASLNDLGTSEAARGQFSGALGHLQQAERWNPETPGLARNLGFCAFKLNDFAEAIRGLSRALAEHPEDAPVRAMLGMSYFGSEKYADAARTFEPLGARGMQDASVGYAWAASLTRMGESQKAAEVLGQFENSDLSNDALLLVGQLWTEMADYEHAVKVFQRVLQREPSLPKAHFFEGLAYLRWEKWNEAAADFQAELALTPDDIEAKYDLGFIYLQQGHVDEASKLFNEVLAAQPTYANAQYQIGKIMLDRGQWDEAIAHLENAARLTPEVDYIHYQLQVAYRKRSRTADADRELAIYKELKAKAGEHSSAPKQNP